MSGHSYLVQDIYGGFGWCLLLSVLIPYRVGIRAGLINAPISDSESGLLTGISNIFSESLNPLKLNACFVLCVCLCVFLYF